MQANVEQSPSTTSSASEQHGLTLAEGERYIGLTVFENKPHHLILLPGEFTGSWKKALAFAEKAGGVLPSRIDALILFDRARDQFKRDWHWTSQEYAGDADYAWCQYFGSGGQSANRKGSVCLARAVRRVPIQ